MQKITSYLFINVADYLSADFILRTNANIYIIYIIHSYKKIRNLSEGEKHSRRKVCISQNSRSCFQARSLNTEDQRFIKHAKQSVPCESGCCLNLETYETVGEYSETRRMTRIALRSATLARL